MIDPAKLSLAPFGRLMPLLLALLGSAIFLLVEVHFQVIRNHYTWVHGYYGLVFPLFFGCLKVGGWDVKYGLLGTFSLSFLNEVITDPIDNGVPFMDAWHHFAADMAGMMLFCIAYTLIIRPPRSKMNTRTMEFSQAC